MSAQGPLRASAPVAADREADLDRALLRAHEPVVRYTKGELFFPTAVGPYVAQCSLWAGVRGRDATLLVPAGELTLERLSEEASAHRDSAAVPALRRYAARPRRVSALAAHPA